MFNFIFDDELSVCRVIIQASVKIFAMLIYLKAFTDEISGSPKSIFSNDDVYTILE